MKSNIKKDTNSLLKLEKSLYDFKTYIKDTFLVIIDKIDDLETKINQLKSEQISKKNIKENDSNKSLLGDYIASGSYSNRKNKNDSTDTLEPQAKKKKLRGKNDTRILTSNYKKMSQENKNEEKSKSDEENSKGKSEDESIVNKEIKSDEENSKSKSEDKSIVNKEVESEEKSSVNKEVESEEKSSVNKEVESEDKSSVNKEVKSDEEKSKGKKSKKQESKKDEKSTGKEINDEEKKTKKSDKKVSKEVTSSNPDLSSLLTSEFSYKGKHTERMYDLLKMKERFSKKFGDNWFTVPQCTKLFFNSTKKPPMDEWISALDCMFDKKMLDRNEGVKLKYKVIE